MEGTQRNCQHTDLALAYEKSLGQNGYMHLEAWRAAFQGDILTSMVPCLAFPGIDWPSLPFLSLPAGLQLTLMDCATLQVLR